MSMKSDQKIERYLHNYAIMLEYWSSNEGDTHLMADYRELLQESILSLSEGNRQQLSGLDARAKALLDACHGDETWDVTMLRQVVAIADPEYRHMASNATGTTVLRSDRCSGEVSDLRGRNGGKSAPELWVTSLLGH